jgi:hypothetical protein
VKAHIEAASGLASCPFGVHIQLAGMGKVVGHLVDEQGTSRCKLGELDYETASDIGPSAWHMRIALQIGLELERLGPLGQLFACLLLPPVAVAVYQGRYFC